VQFRAEARELCNELSRGATENTGMTRTWLGIGVLTLGAVAVAAQKQEQPSLGAVAKAVQEEKAKAAAKQKTESKTPAKSQEAAKAAPDSKTAKATPDADAGKAAGKKYTNEDLDRRPRPYSPTSSPYSTSSRTRTTSMTRSTDLGADEAYWRRRSAPLRERLRQTTERLNAAKANLESKKAPEGLDVSVANGRSSPAQAERDRLASYVAQLESQLQRDEEALRTLEEMGRRAGALPGWFR